MTIEDLLADETFISYCKKDNPEAVLQWESYLQENPGHQKLAEVARQQFFDLFNALAIADLQEQEALLLSRIYQEDVPPVVQMNENNYRNGTRKLYPILMISGAIAVAVLIIFIIRSTPDEPKVIPAKYFVANYGERKNFQLPDGSNVTLNAGSRINIDADYGLNSRDILLEGEAFFDVKHNQGQPFIVHTPAMDVKALGTAFNVKAYPNEKGTETSLLRGSVEVTLKKDNDRKLILKPYQKVHWGNILLAGKPASNEAIHKKQVIKTSDSLVSILEKTESGDVKEIAWIENKLVFNDEPLQDIAILLERWYGINVVFKDEEAKYYRFTGTFEKENLKMVLDVMKESRSFHYQILPGNTMTVKIGK